MSATWSEQQPRTFSTWAEAARECDYQAGMPARPVPRSPFGDWIVKRFRTGEVLRINGTWAEE